MGFPDIKLIEPLAGLLEVSVLELMRSEYIEEEQRPADCGPEVASGMADLAKLQQKVERRSTALAVILTAGFVCLLFLADQAEWFQFLEFGMMVFPWVCWGICPVLLVICWLRHRRRRPWHLLALCAFILFILPFLAIMGALLFLVLSLRMGAEVPW